MSAGETATACIGAAAGLLLIATYGWDAWHKRRTRTRFQRTARQAARTGQVTADVDGTRRLREIAQLYAMCPDITRITDIPHQTRRTEDNQ